MKCPRCPIGQLSPAIPLEASKELEDVWLCDHCSYAERQYRDWWKQ